MSWVYAHSSSWRRSNRHRSQTDNKGLEQAWLPETTGIDKVMIRDLAEILNETDLTDIEIEQGDLRIRVSRQITMPGDALTDLRTGSGSRRRLRPRLPLTAPATPASDPSKNAVPSPMVGTVYLAPAPGARDIHRGWHSGQGRPDAPDHRSHEDDEPDPLAARRHRYRDSRQ